MAPHVLVYLYVCVCVCVCPSVRVRVHIKSEIIRKIFGCSTWATKQIYNPNEQQ